MVHFNPVAHWMKPDIPFSNQEKGFNLYTLSCLGINPKKKIGKKKKKIAPSTCHFNQTGLSNSRLFLNENTSTDSLQT